VCKGQKATSSQWGLIKDEQKTPKFFVNRIYKQENIEEGTGVAA